MMTRLFHLSSCRPGSGVDSLLEGAMETVKLCSHNFLASDFVNLRGI